SANRPSPPGRRARLSSGPQKPRRASTTIAPAPASVTTRAPPPPPPPPVRARGCAGPAAAGASAAAPASELAQRDVVGDADIGGEGGYHRAVLLKREIDGAPRLGLVRPLARHGEHHVQRRVAARLHLAARAPHEHVE